MPFVTIWAPSALTGIILTLPPMQLYLGRLSPLIKSNQNRYSWFRENSHFALGPI
jgi:hypothetical protein